MKVQGFNAETNQVEWKELSEEEVLLLNKERQEYEAKFNSREYQIEVRLRELDTQLPRYAEDALLQSGGEIYQKYLDIINERVALRAELKSLKENN